MRVLGLLALALPMLGSECGEVTSEAASISVTLDAVPDDQKQLLVVPPYGFTVDVRYSPSGGVLPATLWLALLPFDGGPAIDLSSAIVRNDATGATALIPSNLALQVGSHYAVALASGVAGDAVFDTLAFAVRNHKTRAPLAYAQWVRLDFVADRDANGQPDFPDDLLSFGLASAAAPQLSAAVKDWVIAETVSRTQSYYSSPNPSGLPGGDGAAITFSALPPVSGPQKLVLLGAQDPTGGITLGNVLYDAGNANLADVACDNFLATGIFPREFVVYGFDALYQAAFGPLLSVPVGTHPLDAVVLGPAYDSGNPEQLARHQQIELGVATFAQALATITAHEAGHTLGLVPPGAPGAGLFGGATGAEYTHDVTPSGATPSQNFLMNKGQSFSFGRLIGAGGQPLPRFRELDFAYLRGRLVIDAKVTGIHHAPTLISVAPAQIQLSGPLSVALTVQGQNLMATPTIKLRGPLVYTLVGTQLVGSTQASGIAVVPQLVAGTYAVEVTNPDGQARTLSGAVTVVP